MKRTECRRCSAPIPPERHRGRGAVFCSRECARLEGTESYRAVNPHVGTLCSGSIGALGELVVAIDLLKRGFEVFRAISPASTCDLAVLRDGKLLRIEVRTGHRTATGTLMFRRSGTDQRDHYAVVIHADGPAIHYEPPLA